MKKQLLVVFSVCALAISCSGSQQEADELAGESELDGEDSKADHESTFTYLDIRPDLRRCAYPTCGGFWVDRVNRAKTKCASGWDEQCYVTEIDWSQSGLDQDAIDKARVYISESALAEGPKVLVRGEIETREDDLFGELATLVVTEAWLAATDNVPDGVFVKLEDAGIRCIAAPCESTRELKLNSTLTAMIADLDLSPLGLSDQDLEALAPWQYLYGPGLIVAGDRYRVYQDGRSGRARRAYQIYVPLLPAPAEQDFCPRARCAPGYVCDEELDACVPVTDQDFCPRALCGPGTTCDEALDACVPAPCYVGGCSGQICSDQEGVVSTCEWRDQYACYWTATCERQAGGECGWTATPELDACLADL